MSSVGRAAILALLLLGCSRSSNRHKYSFPSSPEPVKGCSITWLRPIGLNLMPVYKLPASSEVWYETGIRTYADVKKLLGGDHERLRGKLTNRKFCTLYLGKEILPHQVEPDQIVFVDPSTHEVIDHVNGF
jgi:hypothetical protein